MEFENYEDFLENFKFEFGTQTMMMMSNAQEFNSFVKKLSKVFQGNMDLASKINAEGIDNVTEALHWMTTNKYLMEVFDKIGRAIRDIKETEAGSIVR